MAKYVQRESVVMRKPISIPENVEYEPVYNRTLDWGAKRLQLQYDLFPDMKPTAVYGDGSCLFNSASMALFGSQDMSEELRVRTVIEMVTNAEKYKKHPIARDYVFITLLQRSMCGLWKTERLVIHLDYVGPCYCDSESYCVSIPTM